MRIAVIGSGVAGMGAAYALKDKFDVTLFERDTRFGGHANTQTVEVNGQTVDVDTGFIVYNYRNYPNLTGLFDHLGVKTKWSDMSFGISLNGAKTEFAFDNFDKIFSQRSNLVSRPFWRMLTEIKRFNTIAPEQLDNGDLDGVSLGDWVTKEGFSEAFLHWFILPMGGAIWSTPMKDIMDFPARNFVSFFRNHDLMTGLEPAQRWRTVDGGSKQYVSRLISGLGDRAKCGAEIVRVDRATGRPRITFNDGTTDVFDQVVLATHAPTAARLLDDQSALERGLLSRFRVSRNDAILHSDPTLMPKRKKVWSSWNFLTRKGENDFDRPAPVTYWMNRLQSLPKSAPLFVSLNPHEGPREELVHGRFAYDHPVFETGTFDLQKEMDLIQGQGGVWYAGAWLGYGFHEDGLRSGLRVAAALGAVPDWAGATPEPFETYLEAAE